MQACCAASRGDAPNLTVTSTAWDTAAMDPAQWLQLQRTVRFGETDAAGVMHFHELLRWCHEAYEESLERFGLPAASIFPQPSWAQSAASTTEDQQAPAQAAVALPIVHCQADFRRPLLCGDGLTIQLRPERLDPGSFTLHCRFLRQAEVVATGLTRHLAIEACSRRRCPLPEGINRWLEASSLNLGVRPL